MSKNHYRSLSAVFPVILRKKDGKTEVLHCLRGELYSEYVDEAL